MKSLLILLAAVAFSSCSESTSSLERKMVVSPKQIVFVQGESEKQLSVTHTCTCPFHWSITCSDSSGIIKPISGSGDNPSVSITIDRSKLTVDTLSANLYIRSNYGDDSVAVTIYR